MATKSVRFSYNRTLDRLIASAKLIRAGRVEAATAMMEGVVTDELTAAELAKLEYINSMAAKEALAGDDDETDEDEEEVTDEEVLDEDDEEEASPDEDEVDELTDEDILEEEEFAGKGKHCSKTQQLSRRRRVAKAEQAKVKAAEEATKARKLALAKKKAEQAKVDTKGKAPKSHTAKVMANLAALRG